MCVGTIWQQGTHSIFFRCCGVALPQLGHEGLAFVCWGFVCLSLSKFVKCVEVKNNIMGKKTVEVVLLLVLIISIFCMQYNATTSGQVLQAYGRERLLSLRKRAAPGPDFLDYVPEELSWQHGDRRPRKRERRGGIQHRLCRRCNKPPLPINTMLPEEQDGGATPEHKGLQWILWSPASCLHRDLASGRLPGSTGSGTGLLKCLHG